LIGLLEDAVEVADGLMVVQNQTEANRVDHGGPSTSGGKTRIL
jgi:hypothetical protein